MFYYGHSSRKGANPDANKKTVELVQYTSKLDVNVLILLENEIC